MSSSEHVLDATTCHTHTPRHLCQHNRRAIVKAHAVRSSANAHQIGVREGRNRVRKLRTGGNHDERGRCHESAMQFAAFLLAESASRVVQACERATQQPRDARSRALARCDARCIHFKTRRVTAYFRSVKTIVYSAKCTEYVHRTLSAIVCCRGDLCSDRYVFFREKIVVSTSKTIWSVHTTFAPTLTHPTYRTSIDAPRRTCYAKNTAAAT